MIAQFYLKLAFLQVYRRIGNNDKIQETIDLTEPLLEKGLDKRSSAVWHHNVGLVKWYSGEHREALARYKMSKELFAQVSDKSEIGLTAEIGLTLWNIGQLEEALLYLSEAQIKADEILDYLRGLKIASHLVLLHLSKGELDLAAEYTATALKKAIAVKYTSDISRIIGNRGILKIHLGDYTGALQDLEFDKQALQEKNQQLACTLANLGRLYNLMGDQEKGRLFALEALDIATEKQYRPRKIIALRALAECSDKTTSIDLLKQAVDLSKNYQFLDEAACYLSLANLQDDVLEKQRYWERGTKLLHQIGASKWLVTATPQNPPLIPLVG
jgi:tetratricopeptide (TPR) repeat protein